MFLKVTENKNTIKGKSKLSKVTKDKINSGSKLKSNPGTRCLSLYQTNVRDSNKRIETHTCTHTWKTAGKQWKNSRKALSFPIKIFHLETFGEGKKSTRVETWTKFRQNFPVLDRARFSSCGCGDARGDEPVLQDIPSIEEKASYRQWLRLFNGDFLLLSLSLSLSLSSYLAALLVSFALLATRTALQLRRFRAVSAVVTGFPGTIVFKPFWPTSPNRTSFTSFLLSCFFPSSLSLTLLFLFTLNSICIWKNLIQEFLLAPVAGLCVLWSVLDLGPLETEPVSCKFYYCDRCRIWPNAFVFSTSPLFFLLFFFRARAIAVALIAIDGCARCSFSCSTKGAGPCRVVRSAREIARGSTEYKSSWFRQILDFRYSSR